MRGRWRLRAPTWCRPFTLRSGPGCRMCRCGADPETWTEHAGACAPPGWLSPAGALLQWALLTRTHTPYRVSVDEYITFRKQGFLVVRGLLSPEDIRELREHTE